MPDKNQVQADFPHPRRADNDASGTSVVTVMVFTARICGLGAACTGALSLLGWSAPLLLHLALGCLLVAALCVLAYRAHPLAGKLVLDAVVVAAAIPVFGLLELTSLPSGLQGTLLWLHPAAGIGGIGLAEILAQRIKRHRE